MSKFKDALERGKAAHHRQAGRADVVAPTADFGAEARAWLNNVVLASLEAAKAEVARDVTIDIDSKPRREVKALAPSVRFQIYTTGGLGKAGRTTFTISVAISGEVSVSAPGMVAEVVGNIGERSGERFRNWLAKLIEDTAKGT
ncbi:hypothetical protein FJ970_25120 [Mesorhizobium sp. B2-1-8]|uniref:hypothetical protein n=1 Tax=Mesorhizobium sp. B2-1-8 TaxID=2589967 RepID=UPI00112E7948|nr:hypothetical protein [Mesorhizobium sp. B2-1-8]UCI18339.1 hypothetical protein FJ970_25120 [Mesorhizobium sp. B2-1-8]